MEAGLVPTGTEVKSLLAGRATLTEGFGQITNNEACSVAIGAIRWAGT